jgi:hypothetical protein
MYHLAVQIVRFVDDCQPGVVACEFSDAAGRLHTLIDKVPIFSLEDCLLDEKSDYPRPGVVRVEVMSRSRDVDGREVVRITTEIPDHVDSTEQLSEFSVFATQISPCA